MFEVVIAKVEICDQFCCYKGAKNKRGKEGKDGNACTINSSKIDEENSD